MGLLSIIQKRSLSKFLANRQKVQKTSSDWVDRPWLPHELERLEEIQAYRSTLVWKWIDIRVDPEMLEIQRVWTKSSQVFRYYIKLMIGPERVAFRHGHNASWSIVDPKGHAGHVTIMYYAEHRFRKDWCQTQAMFRLRSACAAVMSGPCWYPARFGNLGPSNMYLDNESQFYWLVLHLKDIIVEHGMVDHRPHKDWCPHITMDVASTSGLTFI